MKIAIVDDEKAARSEVIFLVEKYLTNYDIVEFNNGSSIISYENKQDIDIAFLDIHLGDIDGLALAKLLKEINEDIKIIFVSAYNEYALDGYDIGVFDYLTKPLCEDRFNKMINRLPEKKSLNISKQLQISSNKKTYYIDTDSIVYIESRDRKTWINTTTAQYETSHLLSELEDKLTQDNFFRCHKGYIININYLLSLESFSTAQYDITLKNYEQIKIPLSRNKYRLFKELIEN